MTVKAMLDSKGRDVVTIGPEATIADAARLLASHRIGAAVVTMDAGRIVGIVSERDIVRAVASGPDTLDKEVASIMTASVRTCHEGSTINEVMELMTQGRFRHLPVEKDGKLDGIISIGDVVKRRISEVEQEAEQIREYIATA